MAVNNKMTQRVVWFYIQRISFVAINELFMSISFNHERDDDWNGAVEYEIEKKK